MLLNQKDTVLLVVDIQRKLMAADAGVTGRFIRNVKRLVETATVLGLPIVVTEQNPERLGGTIEEIDALLGDTPRFSKLEFSCTANPAVAAALKQTGRSQCLLVGMETHICVMQTALGLVEAGFQPYVVTDGTLAAAKDEHKAGLRRMIQEKVSLVTTQMAIFELLRAAGTPEFRKMLPHLKAGN